MKPATLLSLGLGLVAGYVYGDEVRRRKNAETYAEDAMKLLEKLSFTRPPAEQQLKKIAIVLNDAHKQISTVSKALVKPAQ
jgi:hypothetical protein